MNFKWNNDRWHSVSSHFQWHFHQDRSVAVVVVVRLVFGNPKLTINKILLCQSIGLFSCCFLSSLCETFQIESTSLFLFLFWLPLGHFCFGCVRTHGHSIDSTPHEISNVFHVQPKNKLSVFVQTLDLKAQTTEVINLKCKPCDSTPRKSLFTTNQNTISKCVSKVQKSSGVSTHSNAQWIRKQCITLNGKI